MISTREMKSLEEQSGIPSSVLMERAGKGVASTLLEKMEVKSKSILILAYHGKNGGDGFIAANHLAESAEVDILFLGDEDKFSEETKHAYLRIENDPRIQMLSIESIDFSDYDTIIDAVFGTGAHGAIQDPIATILTKVSKAKAFKVALDVPSGIDPDTGEKSNAYFDADLIITMHDIKKGLGDYSDKTIIVDIGLGKSE